MKWKTWITVGLSVFALSLGQSARAEASRDPAAIPCTPESESLLSAEEGLDPAFCAEWNPEFVFRGHRCCAKAGAKGRAGSAKKKRRATWCAPQRGARGYCEEMTDQQRKYVEMVSTGKVSDVLELISYEMGRKGEQSFCTVNNGFLAWGRPILPSPENRLQLRTPERCANFGTDGMVGLLEWLGRRVAAQYSDPKYEGVRLTVGDVSAPKGGCLAGRGGRRGHASHTAGLDVDLGFLVAKPNAKSPLMFHTRFDAAENWWLLKQIFQNPYACVKVVFLDRKLIGKIARVAANDPEWAQYRRFVRHVKFHKNHFHVRVGSMPGEPGCTPNSRPELETEDEGSEDLQGLPDFLEELENNRGPELEST